MNWNRLQYAGLLMLTCFASACTESVGICQGSLQGRDTVVSAGQVVYGGQAIMNRACAVACHSSKNTGAQRNGVPAGMDFDLLPIDQEDVAGTRERDGRTVVKLKSSQIEGLRARQKKIVELRDEIWQQIQDGLMPPNGMFDAMMSNIFASSEKAPCKPGKEFSQIPQVQTREVLRNWLACGAPLVETNSTKVDDKVATAGAAGYQYGVCEPDAGTVITLDQMLQTGVFSACGACHNVPLTTPPPRFLDAQMLAKELRTKGCSGKRFVTPGKPEESYLLDRLKGGDVDPRCKFNGIDGRQMPPDDPLSERAIAQVTAWIAAGAPATAADVGEPPNQSVDEGDTDAGDEPTPDDEPPTDDQQSTDGDGAADAAIKDAGATKDAGPAKDAGAVKDAGRDAGKDAGRDAGR
jgi:hypothetical protein